MQAPQGREVIPKFEILGPEMLSKLTRELAKRIDGKYDVLLVVKNGAMDMATTFFDEFNHYREEKDKIKRIEEVKVSSYKGIGKRGRLKLQQGPEFSESERVLVLDDISDTGHTLISVEEYLQRFKCDITMATIYVKPHTKYLPDFYIKETKSWVVFPREAREAITELNRRVTSKIKKDEKSHLRNIIKRIAELNSIEPSSSSSDI